MKAQKKQPELRFKGFTDDWEQVELINIFEKKNELNGNQFPENRTISIATMTFKPSGNGADKNSIPKYKVLRLGDIAYEGHQNKDFTFGRFLMNDIGDGIISPRFTFLHSKVKLNINFWKYYIHYEPVMRNILVKSTKKGTMMNELVITDFLKQEMKVPENSEQKIIGFFLTRLDQAITLQQRKLELLKKLKQGYLQQMFPTKDKVIPQLRFSIFNGDWEQVKLGDLGHVAMNKRIFKGETSSVGEIPFYKIGTFGKHADAFISRELFEEYRAKYPYPKVGDLLISASGSIGKVVEYTGEDEYFQDSNIVWLAHDTKITNAFLKQIYQTIKWAGLEGSTIKRLYNKNILDTQICMPSLSEQNLISKLLTFLDDAYVLQQSKFKQQQQLKQAYLQKLFP